MPGPAGKVLTAGYTPGFGTQTCFFKASITNAAQRLGTILTVPVHGDRLYDATQLAGTKTTPYNHVFFQVPSTAANTVWLSWDNNTAPVVGGPGMELQIGVVYPFEFAGDMLLRPNAVGDYLVNAGTAFQLIAAAGTFCNIWFCD